MEGLALGAPLQAWKPAAPAHRMAPPRSPITARKLCVYVGTAQPHYPLSVAFAPFRAVNPGPPRIRSAYTACYSSSKQNINGEEEAELKINLARAGGLVMSVAMAFLSLQGMFCRPAFAARPWPSTPSSTSTPELDSVKDEEIAKIFTAILQSRQDEDTSSEDQSPYPNPSPDLGPLPSKEELLEGFQRLPPEFQQELVKGSLMAPIVAGNIDMAVQMLDTIIQNIPDDVDWKLLKACILDDSDRTAESKITFEQILQQEPYNAHALQGLATVMHKLGEDDAMIKMVEELVKNAQEHEGEGVAYNMKLVLAHVYIVQDDIEGALEQYHHLINENPEDFRPYLCQGIIYSVLDKKDEAKECFEKYKELVPETFSNQEFVDDVLLKVKTESEKLSQAKKKEQKLLEEGKSPDEAKQAEKVMKQPKFR